MSFETSWARFHHGQRPVGWMLREDGAANWVRFHSLPQSKRYAATDEERSIILTRQNSLAMEVLGDETCWLIQTQWVSPPGETDVADQYDPFRATRELGLEMAFEFLVDDGEESRPWRTYAGHTAWLPGRFDDLLLSIADEKAGPTIWMGSNGALFAPYDGGVDLFLSELSEVNRLKQQHADWLSDHPLGL